MAKEEAIHFYEEGENWKPNAIYFMGDPNNTNEIVITSDNKEYVRGDSLCVEFNGCQIFAGLDQVIYINTKTKTIFIRENKKLTEPERREYLVLLSFFNGDALYQSVQGRQETFDYLISVIEDIDLDNTLVLAETVQYKDAISAHAFMKKCIDEELVSCSWEDDLIDYYLS